VAAPTRLAHPVAGGEPRPEDSRVAAAARNVTSATHAPTNDVKHPRIRWFAGWTCAYLALAIAATWPVARVLTTHLPHDLGDPVLSLTLLQWNAMTPLFTSRWWDGVGFYPLANTLTFSDPRLGASLLSTPIFWVTGSAIAGYNVVFILSYACSALAAHALVRRLTRSDAAGFVAGCAYGFAPFRSAHLAHLELLLAWWMPLTLLAAHAWLESRSRRALALLAVTVAAQGLFTAYYLPMLGLLLALWALWFAAGRVPARQFAELAGAAMLGVAALAPLLLHYWRVHEGLGLYRSISDIRHYSADISSIWSAAPDVRLWPSFTQENAERYLFPGLTIVVLTLWSACTRRAVGEAARFGTTQRILASVAVAGAGFALVFVIHGPWQMDVAGVDLLAVSNFRKPLSVAIAALIGVGLLSGTVRAAARTRSIFAFYALAAGVMFLLSLGPEPTLFDVRVLYKAPYSWLMLAPGFEGSLRAPARFGMIMALALSVTAGLAWHQLTARLSMRRTLCLMIAAAAIILAEGWASPLTVVAAPQPIAWPARCAGLPRLELPMGDPQGDGAAQYRAMLDGARSVNGLSGYMPPHTMALIFGLRRHDSDALAAIAEHGPLCISTDLAQDGAARTVRWLSAPRRAEPLGASAGRMFHFITRSSPLVTPPTGATLPLAAAASREGPVSLPDLTDGHRLTMWETAGGQRRGHQLRLTLACPATLQSVGLLQDGGRFARRLAIEVSGDGAAWRRAWDGTTSGLVARAALRDPRQPWTDIPVAADGVREIRLSLLRADAAAGWAVAEVRVRGRCEP
jgi:hypothetical protein